MERVDFRGIELPRLGFGFMRLPKLASGKVDFQATQEIVDVCMAAGVNYFDTAYAYHNGESELAIGKTLSKYPRESYFLATKYPGHQIAETYDPEEVFENQLERCGVEYFDFYLLHNVYEKSLDVYMDPQWGILDYFKKQKELGRIKHLGFSTHARPECLRKFLEVAGQDMEFCQIQMNYLDWTLQDARAKCGILAEYGIPVWVMEGVRGGRLARLDEAEMARLERKRPGKTPAWWAFKWLQTRPEPVVILSGMSTLEQAEENIATFSDGEVLNPFEMAALEDLAEGMKQSVPCTACEYCLSSCPKELDIPRLLDAYNDLAVGMEGGTTVSMFLESLDPEKLPDKCIGCGACEAMCPQGIAIPEALADLAEKAQKITSWETISAVREQLGIRIRLAKQLKEELAGADENLEPQVLVDELLQDHTTFQVGGPADLFVDIQSVEQIRVCQAFAKKHDLPLYILGAGSNVLTSDAGVRGLVVHIGEGLSDIQVVGSQIHVQAGATNEAVAEAAWAAGLTGYEFASGIPGCIGGAAIMNAGAYDGEFKNVAVAAECLTPEGELVVVPAEEADWSYRHSMMMDKGYVVVGAVLQLQPGDPEAIRAYMDDLKERRESKQPLEMASAGSTFKRPTGYYAGKLIQDAGLRGHTVGHAQVSEKHCGFVVNFGGATACEVLQVIRDVQKTVHDQAGVDLETEVRMWGFED